MFINNSTFRGDFESEVVLNAICAGFKTKPEKCSQLLDNDSGTDKGIGSGGIIAIIICSLIFLVVIL